MLALSRRWVSIDAIKRLRALTQAPLGDIKAALVESKEDEKQALELLTERGAQKLALRAERDAGTLLFVVRLGDQGKSGGIAQIACETDFSARTPEMAELGGLAAQVAIAQAQEVQDPTQVIQVEENTIHDTLKVDIGRVGLAVGENVQIKGAWGIVAPEKGVIGCYAHGGLIKGTGRLAAMVGLTEGEGNDLALQAAYRCAMQAVAMQPESLQAFVEQELVVPFPGEGGESVGEAIRAVGGGELAVYKVAI